MTSTSQAPVVVIGGGLSGLIASTRLAAAGVPAVLVEKTSLLGGRAASRHKQGFVFNLGPHGLYRLGHMQKALKDLGVEVRGGVPGASGGFVVLNGRRHTLPAGLASMLTTGALGLQGKFEWARFLSQLAAIDAATIQCETLASWLGSRLDDVGVRQLVQMLVRVTSFTNDPDHQSAGAAIEQLQLGIAGSVLYVDGGWRSIVDGLQRAAVASGVRISSAAPVVALERSSARMVEAVRFADRSTLRASAVIVTGGPADVDSIASTRFTLALPPPVRIATLDVALRSLPNPLATTAYGVDAPLYFSVHSAVAALAPTAGATIHVSKYLRPGEIAGPEEERELEALMDMMQPGWRNRLAFKRYLPSLTVTHAEVTAAQGGVGGRPVPRLPGFDNVWIAGDWVGPRGQLSDAAAASASDAAAEVVAAMKDGAIPARARHDRNVLGFGSAAACVR
jgi:phytoene dehydrogenase-like protein